MMHSAKVLLLIVMVFVSGCGGEGASGEKRTVETVPASGTLTLDDKPFGPIHIDLLPLEKKGDHVRTAKANVKDDGSFVLGTYEEADGAAPGSYRVVLGNMGENLMDPPPAVEETQVLIPTTGGDSIKIILKSAGNSTGTSSLLNKNLKRAK